MGLYLLLRGHVAKSTTEWISDGGEVQLDVLELDPTYRELRLEKTSYLL